MGLVGRWGRWAWWGGVWLGWGWWGRRAGDATSGGGGAGGAVERPRCGVVVVMGALVGWVGGMGHGGAGAGCWVVGAPAATAG